MSALAVLGTSSWAGKSLLTTALARWFTRRGVRVAPFKAHNMSNNARVVDGGEIGSAQYFQALAAREQPDVRMNPVLIKPEGSERSQVIIDGHLDAALSAAPWPTRSTPFRPVIARAFASLAQEFDLVLIEGSGSPAEVNLRATDLANLHTIELADAQALLVCDIDRGGAFAHLYGTWALLRPAERRRIGGFVLNRFQGDATLLPPGPQILQRRTGVPTVGVLPMLRHDLPDEDGVQTLEDAGAGPAVVGVIRYPTGSNLDEFRRLSQVARVRWITEPTQMEGIDLLILPGSKSVAQDLRWLRATGIAGVVTRRAADAGLIVAICGGQQMLGTEVADPHGIDGAGMGLGLLPVRTRFAADKLLDRRAIRFPPMPDPWHVLEGCRIDAYEIRHGRIEPAADTDMEPQETGIVTAGSVVGVSFHGLFESEDVLASLFGPHPIRTLDRTFETLADAVDEHLDTAALTRMAGL